MWPPLPPQRALQDRTDQIRQRCRRTSAYPVRLAITALCSPSHPRAVLLARTATGRGLVLFLSVWRAWSGSTVLSAALSRPPARRAPTEIPSGPQRKPTASYAPMASTVPSNRLRPPPVLQVPTSTQQGAPRIPAACRVKLATTAPQAASCPRNVLLAPSGTYQGARSFRRAMPARPASIAPSCRWYPRAVFLARSGRRRLQRRSQTASRVQQDSSVHSHRPPRRPALPAPIGAPQAVWTASRARCALAATTAQKPASARSTARQARTGPWQAAPSRLTVWPAPPAATAPSRPPPPPVVQREHTGHPRGRDCSAIVSPARLRTSVPFRPPRRTPALQEATGPLMAGPDSWTAPPAPPGITVLWQRVHQSTARWAHTATHSVLAA